MNSSISRRLPVSPGVFPETHGDALSIQRKLATTNFASEKNNLKDFGLQDRHGGRQLVSHA